MINDLLIRQLFEHLIKQVGLTARQAVLMKACRCLFDDWNAAVLEKNQKFDFSFRFSSGAPMGLRFTYNDFDEKLVCRKKFLDIFSLLATRSTRALAKHILNLVPTPAPFQTTLGLEWLAHEKRPRLKIYMEELPCNTTIKDRQLYLKKITRILGWEERSAARLKKTDPAAIAVDFLAGGEQHLKLYTQYETEEGARRFLHKIHQTTARQSIDRFLRASGDEPFGFYAVSQRWHDHALRPVGLKLYKVYNARQIDDFQRSHREIAKTLEAFRLAKTPQAQLISQTRALCARRSADFYPVLLAFDPGVSPQIDVYYALQNLANRARR